MIKWSENFSVSHAEIDNQHKELIAIIEELVTIISTEDYSYINIVEIVSRLENYIKVHFDYEEKLMLQYSYPYIEEHTKLHNDLRYRIHTTNVFDLETPQDFYGDTLNYLVGWLSNHIMQVDKKLGLFMKEMNVE
jgi:hemerythrin